LTNASEQPLTEAVVEVRLREAQGSASTCRFTISVVPPGMSWFAFDGNDKPPETLHSAQGHRTATAAGLGGTFLDPSVNAEPVVPDDDLAAHQVNV
jgi:hypothetical protein